MKWREILDQPEWRELKKAVFELYREYRNDALTSEEIKDVWVARGAILALRRLLISPMQGFHYEPARKSFMETSETDLRREAEREFQEDLNHG